MNGVELSVMQTKLTYRKRIQLLPDASKSTGKQERYKVKDSCLTVVSFFDNMLV